MGNTTTEPIKITDNIITQCDIADEEIPTENEEIDNPLNIKYNKYQRQQELNDYLREQKVNNLKKNRLLEELNSYLKENIDIKQLEKQFNLEIQNLKKKSNYNKNDNQLIKLFQIKINILLKFF